MKNKMDCYNHPERYEDDEDGDSSMGSDAEVEEELWIQIRKAIMDYVNFKVAIKEGDKYEKGS